MIYDELLGQIYETYEEMMGSHGIDIFQFPIVVAIPHPELAHTYTHHEVTGWKLGRDCIIIDIGDPV